jgi:hypothetical protein
MPKLLFRGSKQAFRTSSFPFQRPKDMRSPGGQEIVGGHLDAIVMHGILATQFHSMTRCAHATAMHGHLMTTCDRLLRH